MPAVVDDSAAGVQGVRHLGIRSARIVDLVHGRVAIAQKVRTDVVDMLVVVLPVVARPLIRGDAGTLLNHAWAVAGMVSYSMVRWIWVSTSSALWAENRPTMMSG